MKFKEFTAKSDDNGKRFDRVTRIILNAENLSEVYKFMRKGLVRLNGKKAEPSVRITEGDIISVPYFLLESNKFSDTLGNDENKSARINSNFVSEKSASTRRKSISEKFSASFPFPIVFENEALLVIDKPYDIPVHGSYSSKRGAHRKNENDFFSVAEAISEFFPSNSLSFKCAPLHRLDRRTTGILVCSKNIEGARWFSEKLSAHQIKKTYIAITEGIIEKTETWRDYISPNEKIAHSSSSQFFTVTASNYGSPATTNVTPLSYGKFGEKKYTLALFEIETGRKHQIRAQSSRHGHPLLGDESYGAAAFPKSLSVKQKLFLHAWKIYFPENQLGIPPEISVPPSANFKEILPRLLIDFQE